MAKRINRPNPTDTCRLKIQTSQLINRLQNHVFTYEEDKDFKKYFMDKSQVSAALGLLKKTLPDLVAASDGVDETGKLTVARILEDLDGRSKDLPADQRQTLQ